MSHPASWLSQNRAVLVPPGQQALSWASQGRLQEGRKYLSLGSRGDHVRLPTRSDSALLRARCCPGVPSKLRDPGPRPGAAEATLNGTSPVGRLRRRRCELPFPVSHVQGRGVNVAPSGQGSVL